MAATTTATTSAIATNSLPNVQRQKMSKKFGFQSEQLIEKKLQKDHLEEEIVVC